MGKNDKNSSTCYMTEKDQTTGVIYSYDIIIAGAGPAGSGCALALRNAGLKVAILDKASFPRDKICGDAISTTTVKFLKKNYPEYAKQLSEVEQKSGITSTRLVSASGKEATIHWHSKAYNCARLQFDNFLFELVKKKIRTYPFTSIHRYLMQKLKMTLLKSILLPACLKHPLL
jgi:2-polyprenyl-6-methoxyphenol hydroxylase-like FAD-dependent oxidoreductase